MSEAVQKNAGTIALIVAIIALVSSLVPQINELRRDFGRNVSYPANGQGGAPGGRPGGMGPGGMGPGGPGMMRGFGPSQETIAKFAERLKLYDEALKTAQGEELLKMRVERDAIKLMTLRMENGGRRIAPGLSEALLKMRAILACPKASALEKNQAEIDYYQQLDRFRGEKEAFIGATEAFKDYPKTAASDNDLANLLAAELQR
ncbi:MAG: hypothetical protein IJS08_18870 [Victivallales bacterium]|nr:hypothetical protein [Victivallales bacterium]